MVDRHVRIPGCYPSIHWVIAQGGCLPRARGSVEHVHQDCEKKDAMPSDISCGISD